MQGRHKLTFLFLTFLISGNLDAAFTWRNGKTYFFKGSQYWRFSNKRIDSGYPRPISKYFVGIPDNVVQLFYGPSGTKFTFLREQNIGDMILEKLQLSAQPIQGKVHIYESIKDYRIFSWRPISIWNGVPPNVDDILKYSNGYNYIFKDRLYYRLKFDDAEVRTKIID